MHPYDQGFLSSASTNASLFESEVWDGEREDSQKEEHSLKRIFTSTNVKV